MTKPIRPSGHARGQLARRGVSEDEVIETIRTSSWQPAELAAGMSQGFSLRARVERQILQNQASAPHLCRRSG